MPNRTKAGYCRQNAAQRARNAANGLTNISGCPPHQRHRPLGHFLAQSVSPEGVYLKTYHHSLKKAYRRLVGNPRHSAHVVIDTQPPKAGKPNG